MNLEGDEFVGLPTARTRTFSNASQQSQHSTSTKQNFPLMTSDSGLYTCSSNTSDCSLQLESDTDCCPQRLKATGFRDDRLQLALQDAHKLRSELERLTKSEQWYKHELRQQKHTRLEDLERIYSQERKFMQENQRLQKECVRLYDKCNELQKELEKQSSDTEELQVLRLSDEDELEENILLFEKEQQMALIKDQQQLIAVLRKQKRSLLEDLRILTEEKDEKVMELQRLLADLEFDNKRITKKCKQYAKERIHLENTLKQSDSKLSSSLEEKTNLLKSMVELKEQLETQQQLLNRKEKEIENIQQHYTVKIQQEDDLDKVHKLSIKYQEDINHKSLEIINLKERLHEMQMEMEDMQKLQQQNELQQRQIDQLNFTLETYRLELEELKASEQQKNNQLDDLHTTLEQMFKERDTLNRNTVEQQNELLKVKKALKLTQDQYEQVQELYKKTQFELELLEMEQGKAQFQNDNDKQEIILLRHKLTEYLQQTQDLSSKIHELEDELIRVTGENNELKQNAQQLKKVIQELEENAAKSKENPDVIEELLIKNNKEEACSVLEFVLNLDNDEDFLELQQQCNKLQQKLDFIKDLQTQSQDDKNCKTTSDNTLKDTNTKLNKSSSCFKSHDDEDKDILNLSVESKKLQENLDKLKNTFTEKQIVLKSLNNLEQSNEGMEKLVTENEILKKKLCDTQTEATRLQIKHDINERTQRYTLMEHNLSEQTAKIQSLQNKLLKNDAELYKLQRKLKVLDEYDEKLEDLQKENNKLMHQLEEEQQSKTDLKRKLLEETDKIIKLKFDLEELQSKNRLTKNKAIQCVLNEDAKEPTQEVKDLRQHVEELQQQQRYFLEQEAHKKEERLQLLNKMMDLQNAKMQNLQQHQREWEEMLTTLNNAHHLEEKTRKELELKRLELEELNQVFAEQNEEFRKLEEFTALLEIKRKQEKEQLKLTFQNEITVMQQHLQDYQQQIEQQKLINEELEKRKEQFQHHLSEDYAAEVAGYKKEIRELKTKLNRLTNDKEDLLEHLKETEQQAKDLLGNKREAICIPDFKLVLKPTDLSIEKSIDSNEVLKHNISEDHLRILTKVLEAEYQRKMQRYDEHIHSLLTNLKSLKKSLKANEEKMAVLSEQQMQTQEELKDLQNTKRNLEEIRLKYEQSQNTIKELKNTLAFERKKFELSDIGKSTQSLANTYEVANLIDDYKKLIQQSAIVTKRPSTTAILDLIQRSNQCVPNLKPLETNVDGLRCELQNFLTSYNYKMPATSLVAAASLSVPPSLMDELRAASEGY
ncbi:hypothetical protein DOY81_004241 [Sarcophaga bullata]|nr:hypothetical protein DOY81_004241 [Sarcophaga bullata]